MFSELEGAKQYTQIKSKKIQVLATARFTGQRRNSNTSTRDTTDVSPLQ